MNRGGLGARSLNIELQTALNSPGEIRVERFGWTFCPGDKVMQVENDYDKEVYNGDLGVVSRIDMEEGELTGGAIRHASGRNDSRNSKSQPEKLTAVDTRPARRQPENRGGNRMATITHDGTKLAFEDRGAGKPALCLRPRNGVRSLVLRPAGRALRPPASRRFRRSERKWRERQTLGAIPDRGLCRRSRLHH
jgi:hypothetical protein